MGAGLDARVAPVHARGRALTLGEHALVAVVAVVAGADHHAGADADAAVVVAALAAADGRAAFAGGLQYAAGDRNVAALFLIGAADGRRVVSGLRIHGAAALDVVEADAVLARANARGFVAAGGADRAARDLHGAAHAAAVPLLAAADARGLIAALGDHIAAVDLDQFVAAALAAADARAVFAALGDHIAVVDDGLLVVGVLAAADARALAAAGGVHRGIRVGFALGHIDGDGAVVAILAAADARAVLAALGRDLAAVDGDFAALFRRARVAADARPLGAGGVGLELARALVLGPYGQAGVRPGGHEDAVIGV